MKRREFLTRVGSKSLQVTILATSAPAMGLLHGCASKTPKTPREPILVSKIGLLPVKEWPPSGDAAPFTRALLPQSKPHQAPLLLSPTQIGVSIGLALRARKDAQRQRLAEALSVVQFVPQLSLSAAIGAALQARGLPFLVFDDSTVAAAIRNNDFSMTPNDIDGILDVQVYGAGYFPADEAGGYSPMLYVRTILSSSARSGEIIDQFDYEADYRDAEGEPRFFTTKREMNVPTLSGFKERATLIREGMAQLCEQVADKIASDVAVRIVRKPLAS